MSESLSTPSAAAAGAAASVFPAFAEVDRAPILHAIADTLDARRPEILARAAAETALTPDELAPEFARMTRTLRLFAGVVRNPAWRHVAIDATSHDSIGPPHDVRRMLVPLGPVAVFGASNFPLAYGVCGGDTASALAAGCPVVVKEHPAHPETGRLIAGLARTALANAGSPPDLLSYVRNERPDDHNPANELVRHPAIAAIGFTGSVRGGLAIEKTARERPVPIPVFAEMGSANPVFVTAAALSSRGEAIAQLLADSILARFGQQCTCPGIIIVPGDSTDFVETLAARLAAAPGRDMLAPWIRDAYLARLAECRHIPGVRAAAEGRPAPGPRGAAICVLAADGATYAAHPTLHEEVFGPAALVVTVDAEADFERLPLLGSLTATLHFEESLAHDRALAERLTWTTLSRIAGRVIANGVPTGVRVAGGMVHGGPFPASNRPETTAVGPWSLMRWCRPVCWQNWPESLLPKGLRS